MGDDYRSRQDRRVCEERRSGGLLVRAIRDGRRPWSRALVTPSARAYAAWIGVRRGEIYDRSRVGIVLRRLTAFHRSQGRTGDVVPVAHVDRVRRTIDIAFQIQR